MTENQILRRQLQGRLGLSDSERIRLAKVGKQLGRKVINTVAQIVRPETILGWHRRLVAKKFDGSKQREPVTRAPPKPRILEQRVVHIQG